MDNVPLDGRELLVLFIAVFTILTRPDAPGVWLLLLIVLGLLALAFRRARRGPRTRTDALAKRLDQAVRANDRKSYVRWVGDRAYLYLDRRFLTAARVDPADPAPVEEGFARAVAAARADVFDPTGDGGTAGGHDEKAGHPAA